MDKSEQVSNLLNYHAIAITSRRLTSLRCLTLHSCWM
jgi:hypothetical protein